MKPPLISAGVSFTHPSRWVWQVSLDGRHVGTVHGAKSCGFTARDLEHRYIGHGYISAEAAIQACVPVVDSH